MAAEAQKDTRTVFVRGISFDVDEKPLEELFSNVGPVKQCFLVRTKGEDKHKGMGFVTYALPEDAQRAIEELNGNKLGGRKLMLELANKRAPLEQRKRKRNETAIETEQEATDDNKPAAEAKPVASQPPTVVKPAPQPRKAKQRTETAEDGQPTASAKHRHMCTVALGGLTPDTVQAAISMAKKAGSVDEVINPAPIDQVEKAKLKADGCSGSIVFIVYKSVPDALTAITKLHGQKLGANNSNQQGGKKKRKLENGGAGEQSEPAPGGAAPVVLWARQLSGEGAHVRKWRVIVRNLPFKVSEAALRTALSKVGFVWELMLPHGPDGRFKGFAFAAYTMKAHAEKAVSQLNGMEVGGRPVAIDWAIAKTQYASASKAGNGAGGGSEDFDMHEDEAGKAGEGDDTEKNDEQDEEVQEATADGYKLQGTDVSDDEDGQGSELEENESEDEDMDDDEDDEGEEIEEDQEEVDEGGEEEGNEDDDKADEEVEEEQKMLHQVMAGLLGEDGHKDEQAQTGKETKKPTAESKEMQKKVKADDKKAEKESAKAVTQEAKTEKGPFVHQSDAVHRTVFVRGLPLDITQITLHAKMEGYGRVKACRLVMDKTTGKPKGTAFVEFHDTTGAQKAADACARGRQNKGPGVVVSGKTLDVDLALSQDGARQLATSKGTTAATKDKRNLYLAKEGDIQPGSAAWNNMSEHDREKRQRAAEERKTKLKSPNFVVARTRLCIRNVPFSMSESKLRALAIKAVRERASKEKPELLQGVIYIDGRWSDNHHESILLLQSLMRHVVNRLSVQ